MVSLALVHHECQHVLTSLAPERSHYLDACLACLAVYHAEHLVQIVRTLQESLSIEREEQIVMVSQMQLVHQGWALHLLLQVADIVDEHIAHHIYLGELSSLLVGDAVIRYACREEDVGKTVDDEAINLLRHRDVEGAGTCGDVSQLHALLLGHDAHCHGGG